MIENRMPPTHAGEILREELEFLGLSANKFAALIGVPTNLVTQILNKQRGVTADTALRLGKFFGTSPEIWLDLQSKYDLKIARLQVGI